MRRPVGAAGQDPIAIKIMSDLAAGNSLGGATFVCHSLASQPGGTPPLQMPVDLASALSGGSAGSDHEDGEHLDYDAAAPPQTVPVPGELLRLNH